MKRITLFAGHYGSGKSVPMLFSLAVAYGPRTNQFFVHQKTGRTENRPVSLQATGRIQLMSFFLSNR